MFRHLDVLPSEEAGVYRPFAGPNGVCLFGVNHPMSRQVGFRDYEDPSVANRIHALQAACIGTRCDEAKLDVVRQWDQIGNGSLPKTQVLHHENPGVRYCICLAQE